MNFSVSFICNDHDLSEWFSKTKILGSTAICEMTVRQHEQLLNQLYGNLKRIDTAKIPLYDAFFSQNTYSLTYQDETSSICFSSIYATYCGINIIVLLFKVCIDA